MENSSQKIYTFLLFSGQAEEAMNYYTHLFDDSEIITITRYGENDAGKAGTVFQATFSLKGQIFMCTDSYIEHEFTFTPAISLYVKCETENELDRIFTQLAKDGSVLMPLDTYPFSKKFGWVADTYGVTWQLSL